MVLSRQRLPVREVDIVKDPDDINTTPVKGAESENHEQSWIDQASVRGWDSDLECFLDQVPFDAKPRGSEVWFD